MNYRTQQHRKNQLFLATHRHEAHIGPLTQPPTSLKGATPSGRSRRFDFLHRIVYSAPSSIKKKSRYRRPPAKFAHESAAASAASLSSKSIIFKARFVRKSVAGIRASRNAE